jgi:hypothetical protein
MECVVKEAGAKEVLDSAYDREGPWAWREIVLASFGVGFEADEKDERKEKDGEQEVGCHLC